jgi:hypothetical protein
MRAPTITKTLLSLTAVAALALPAGAQAAGGADDPAGHVRHSGDDAPGHVRHSGDDDATTPARRSGTASTRSRRCRSRQRRRGSRHTTRTRRVRCARRTTRVSSSTGLRHGADDGQAHLRHGADDGAAHLRHGADDAPDTADDHGGLDDDGPHHS